MIFRPSSLEIMIYGKQGELELYKRLAVRSLVRQFADWLNGHWAASAPTIKDTGGNNRVVVTTAAFTVEGPEADTTYGIRVGTGTTPVTISDYCIETGIAHGNGAGQLYHQVTTVGTVQISGGDAYFAISRQFNNNSGGTITIQEATLQGKMSTYFFLLARDITGAVEVANTKTLAATYTFKITA